MASAPNDISLLSDQDINWFLRELNPIKKFENFVSNYRRIYILTFMNIPHFFLRGGGGRGWISHIDKLNFIYSFLGEKSLNNKDINK